MAGQEHAVGDVQARIAEDLPGRRLVQGEEGTGGAGPLIWAVHAIEDGLYEAVFAGRAVQVDEGRVMFAGHVHKPFEILGRIAERYAVPAFLEGGGDLLAAFQGNFTLGRPAARQQ